MHHSLAIIILTLNEEVNIESCLDSFQGVTAPVFVVDSFSTDRTLAILDARGISYVQHPFKNYANQRNWAQKNLPFDSEWVLHVDAGEQLTPGMAKWLNESFDPAREAVDGYMFARRAIFLGHWIKYGGYHPIYHLRLYRRHLGHCENKVYDQHFVVNGKVVKAEAGADLQDGIMRSLGDFTKNHSRWAIFEAVEYLLAGKETGEVVARLGGNPIERKRWLKSRVFQRMPLFVRSFMYFLYRYIIQLGFLDGRKGLIFHFLQGFWFRFLVDATIYEIEQEMTSRPLEEVVRDKYGIDVSIFLKQESATS